MKPFSSTCYPECIVTSFISPTDQIYFCSSSDGSVLSVDALTGKGASLDVYACDLHATLGVSVSEPTHCTVMDIPHAHSALVL